MTDKMIWVLTSVAPAYDQPPNNLEAWWSDKPSAEQVAKMIHNGKVNEYTIAEAEILLETGNLDIPYGYSYSLFQWAEEK